MSFSFDLAAFFGRRTPELNPVASRLRTKAGRRFAVMRGLGLVAAAALLLQEALGGQPPSLVSGQARLLVHAESGSWLSLDAGHQSVDYALDQPMVVELDGERLKGRYERAVLTEGILSCKGSQRSRNGTRFVFEDRYCPLNDGSFELLRRVEVLDAQPGDAAFNTAVSICVPAGIPFDALEFFVPGIWYRTNFMTRIAGALASDPGDEHYFFREDRLPLPLVSCRDPRTGQTLQITHVGADVTTFTGDRGLARVVDERLQFGALGVSRRERVSLNFLFPGSEGEKNRVVPGSPNSWALRSHPVRSGFVQRYRLVFSPGESPSYSAFVQDSWTRAFNFYDPKLRRVDLRTAYRGLIETLDHYAVGMVQGYDAPGFPFSVLLPEGNVREYNYQMGFIGRQLPNAFFLIQAGLDAGKADWASKGEAIVDFWAAESPLPDGFPRTWYDPSNTRGETGRWRNSDNQHGGTALRVAATGMEGMLAAWAKMRESGKTRARWLEACRGFGDWLVSNQNPDGSFYLAYGSPGTDGHRLPTADNKTATLAVIRFLAQLGQLTQDERYAGAALRAGEFCLRYVHEPYDYAGCVIDNPVTPDRESGQEALSAFLALRDLTRESRWIAAAAQAARYAETWMYAYEVPAESGSLAAFPADRSIVGQTLIATGHSAADLGLAFSAHDFYRLYLFTGDDHFLRVARLLTHNTKQALNWDGSLYPGKPRGLQLEAFSVTTPRRQGVLECLSWNFAAHLDPLVRFKTRFGDMDLDAVEKLPLAKRKALNE